MELQELDVSFVSLDFTSAAGKLLFNILASFAQFESDLISERVRAGILNARAKGVRIGRRTIAPGVRDRILKLNKEGLSIRKIASRLDLGVGTVHKTLPKRSPREARKKRATKTIKKRVKSKGNRTGAREAVYIEWIQRNITKESTLKDLPDDLLQLEDQERAAVAMFLALWLKGVNDNSTQAAISDDELDNLTKIMHGHFAFENLHRCGMIRFPNGYFPLIKLLDPEFKFPVEVNKEHPMSKELDAMSPATLEDHLKYQIALGKQQIDREWDK